MTASLHHVCLSVAELDRAVAWYAAALGYVEVDAAGATKPGG